MQLTVKPLKNRELGSGMAVIDRQAPADSECSSGGVDADGAEASVGAGGVDPDSEEGES